MSGLQEASAICSLVRSTWHTIEFFKDVIKAQKDAELLWRRTKTLYGLLQSLNAVIELRQKKAASEIQQIDASIVLSVESAVKSCHEVLDELAEKCVELGANGDLGRARRMKKSISFTLSAGSIQRLESGLASAQDQVLIAFALLNDVNGFNTSQKLEDNSQTLKRIESMIETIASREPLSPVKEDEYLEPFPADGRSHSRQDSGVDFTHEKHTVDSIRDLSPSSLSNESKYTEVLEGPPRSSTPERLRDLKEQLIAMVSNLHKPEEASLLHLDEHHTRLESSTARYAGKGERSKRSSVSAAEDYQDQDANALCKMPGDTHLINAIKRRLPRKCEALLSDGTDVNERNDDGLTPLIQAAQCKHEGSCLSCLECMRTLINHGANLNESHDGRSVLHTTVENNNLITAKLLVKHGADVDVCSPRTPLFLAVQNGKIDFVHTFVSAKANVNVADEYGWSIIHYAVDSKCKDALLALIQASRAHGIDINLDARCDMDWTPLMHLANTSASEQPENVELARILLEHGADVNATDMDGYSALWYVVQESWSREGNDFVRLLLDSGADSELVKRKAPREVDNFLAFNERRRDSAMSD